MNSLKQICFWTMASWETIWISLCRNSNRKVQAKQKWNQLRICKDSWRIIQNLKSFQGMSQNMLILFQSLKNNAKSTNCLMFRSKSRKLAQNKLKVITKNDWQKSLKILTLMGLLKLRLQLFMLFDMKVMIWVRISKWWNEADKFDLSILSLSKTF